jgi:hypothetical protein
MHASSQYRVRSYRALASAFGPPEVAALARAIPWLETDELARILLTATPRCGRSSS